jgi:hypothetical protein
MTKRKRNKPHSELGTTIRLANALSRDHDMCPRCAVEAAAALVEVRRPEHQLDDPPSLEFCSDHCDAAYDEFCAEVAALKVRIAAKTTPSSYH